MSSASHEPPKKKDLLTIRLTTTCKERLSSMHGGTASTNAFAIVETVLSLYDDVSIDALRENLRQAKAFIHAQPSPDDTKKRHVRDALRVVSDVAPALPQPHKTSSRAS